MTTSTRTRLTFLASVAAGIAAAATTVPGATVSADAPVALAAVGVAETQTPEPAPTAEEQQIIDWALRLFEEAGLQLPRLEIGFYDTKDACGGNKGTYRPQPIGVARVRVCDWHDRETLREAWRRKTLVHELAHAWAHHNLDDEHRQEFVEHRGLDHWNDRDEAWQTRGTEHAAEVITWGIIDRPMRVDVRIEATRVEQLTEAYELLTGATPMNGPSVNG